MTVRITPDIRASILKMLVDEFARSTESWLVYKCAHCDAIKHVANKYGFDEDAIVDAARTLREKGRMG